MLSIVVCAAAGIAGAGTLLLSRNSVSSLPWYAQPQQSTETEEAIESSASKAALMPATVKPPTVTSESPNQQPSPEELVELVKRGHALLKAEATAAQSNIETPPVAVPPTSATQEVAPSVTATVPAPNNETAENLPATQSAIQAQQRLIELGYMSGGADGKWGRNQNGPCLNTSAKRVLNRKMRWMPRPNNPCSQPTRHVRLVNCCSSAGGVWSRAGAAIRINRRLSE
jgi:hypothetical protein